MKQAPYPTPAGCPDPRLGAEATRSLGRAMSPAVEAHMATCSACRAQRAAFNGLDDVAAVPPSGLRERLGRVARGCFGGRG